MIYTLTHTNPICIRIFQWLPRHPIHTRAQSSFSYPKSKHTHPRPHPHPLPNSHPLTHPRARTTIFCTLKFWLYPSILSHFTPPSPTQNNRADPLLSFLPNPRVPSRRPVPASTLWWTPHLGFFLKVWYRPPGVLSRAKFKIPLRILQFLLKLVKNIYTSWQGGYVYK